MFAYILTTAVMSAVLALLNLALLVATEEVKKRVTYAIAVASQIVLAIWGFTVLFQ